MNKPIYKSVTDTQYYDYGDLYSFGVTLCEVILFEGRQFKTKITPEIIDLFKLPDLIAQLTCGSPEELDEAENNLPNLVQKFLKLRSFNPVI